MEIVYKIREYFASLQEGHIRKLPEELTGEEFPGWVIKDNGEVGVGITADSETKINEKFSNVNFYNKPLILNGHDENVLLLTCENSDQRYEFASIAAIFLDPGENGLDRKSIKSEPLTWWRKWKELMGNASVEKSVHSVAGELLALKYLAEKYSDDPLPIWTGAKGQSIDIEHSKNNYEVKTTINKYENIVTVNSQFQLSSIFSADLFFVRLEETPSGISINKLIDKLEEAGYDREDLEENMVRLGLPEYSSAREKSFAVLESRIYEVSEKFPVNELKDSLGEAGNHILKIQYTIDLTGIEYEDIELKYK